MIMNTDEPINSDMLGTTVCFPSSIYYTIKTEFFEDVLAVSNEALEEVKKNRPDHNEIYPVYQSGSLLKDDRMNKFCEYVGSTAWNILQSQGYAVDHIRTVFQEMWCQEHLKYSGHEEHVHGHGSQLVGFYFLETPENCSNIVLHDPRPAKKQIGMYQQDFFEKTYASDMINFTPEPGLLFFANSWLPHSFSRNASDQPMKFVHFTIGITAAEQGILSSEPKHKNKRRKRPAPNPNVEII